MKCLFLYSFFTYYVFLSSYFLKNILFISVSSLACVQRSFSKMKLVKTLLRTQLKQTNPESSLHTPKEIEIVFQNFVDEWEHCNPDIQINLQQVLAFLSLYSIYLVVMLPFTMTFFQNVFCFISFPHELSIF